jgi:hypothetical protein
MNETTNRFHRSWNLFQSSMRVIRDHPKLLVFPFITGVATLVIALFFLLPVAVLVLAPHWTPSPAMRTWLEPLGLMQVLNVLKSHLAGAQAPSGPVISLFSIGVYLLSLFLAVFCNVAFTSQILAALNGDLVSVREGFAMARRRLISILGWTLLAGVVGLAIRALEERFRLVGRIVAGLIGLAWSIASIFAIPVLIREPALANPIKILGRSAEAIKRTWGEALVGYVGMQGANLIFLWLTLAYWISSGLTAWLLLGWWWLAPMGAVWLLCLFVYSYLAGVASKVYLCALYVYASEGIVPDYYDASMMDMAWKVKEK